MVMQNLVERFLRTPQGGRIAAQIELEEQQLSERVKLAAQFAKVRARLAKEGGGLTKELVARTEAILTLQKRHRVEELAAYAELHEVQCKLATIGAEHDRLEGTLKKSASVKIGEFMVWLLEEFDRTRNAINVNYDRRKVASGTDSRGRETGIEERVIHSNRSAVAARCEAIHQARAQAELLKLEAIDEDEVEARLAKIRAGIPPFSTLEKIVQL